MSEVNQDHLPEVTGFLAAREPWNSLSAERLATVASLLEIEYFPSGSLILAAGGEPAQFLYLIRSGAVELRQSDDEGGRLLDRLDEGEVFGTTTLTSGDPPLYDHVACEDLLAYLLPREAFLDLMSEPSFELFFVEILRDRLQHALHAQTNSGSDSLNLFSTTIGELVRRSLVSCSPNTAVADVARKMRAANVSSVVVIGEQVSIVTDRDLRNKVLADELSPNIPVSQVMTMPAITMSEDSLVFEALLLMVERGIHHLPVMRGTEVIGVMTDTDLLRRQSNSPILLPRMLQRARSDEELLAYTHRVASIVSSLVTNGVRVSAIGRVVALAHDALLQRLLSDAEQQLGPPPVPYAWLVLGSEGRLEQTLRTDQDNAIIYADNAPDDAVDYFTEFASIVVEKLVACGFPRCPGNVMATNPRWRQPLSVWQEYFSDWIAHPNELNLLKVAIFFDYRQIGGTLDVTETLGLIVRRARSQRIFLGRLARAALNNSPPLGFFRRFLLEKDGKHKDMLDLKMRGTGLVVDLARLYALEAGSSEVNTVARLHAAADESSLGIAAADDLALAYETLSTLRLQCQLDQMHRGLALSNFVAPAALSDLHRRQLKDAFSIIAQAQEGVEVTFQTGLMA